MVFRVKHTKNNPYINTPICTGNPGNGVPGSKPLDRRMVRSVLHVQSSSTRCEKSRGKVSLQRLEMRMQTPYVPICQRYEDDQLSPLERNPPHLDVPDNSSLLRES